MCKNEITTYDFPVSFLDGGRGNDWMREGSVGRENLLLVDVRMDGREDDGNFFPHGHVGRKLFLMRCTLAGHVLAPPIWWLLVTDDEDGRCTLLLLERHCVRGSGPTKRLIPASAGSGAGAGSSIEILQDIGAPVATEEPVKAEASVEPGAPV